MSDPIKSERRSFLKGSAILGAGAFLVGVPLIYQSPLFDDSPLQLKELPHQEKSILLALLQSWCKGWPERDVKIEKEILGVLNVVRFDKRADLLLAIKLLSFGPTCYFLTGFFNPWRNPDEVTAILKRWEKSQSETERKLYMAFSSIFAAVFYNSSDTWAVVGYPGPPDIVKGSAL